MKFLASISTTIIAFQVSGTLVQSLSIPQYLRPSENPSVQQGRIGQTPLINMPALFPPSLSEPSSDNTAPDSLMISDVINKERSINIFAGFTRDLEDVSNRFDDSSKNTTVLAPLNSELQKLPRKPWENPQDYNAMGSNAYEGQDGEDRAHQNLRRFTEAHVVPASPWKEGEEIETLGGGKLSWEMRDGKRRIQPGDIEVVNVADIVANGQLWVIRGVVNYA
ncbi:hypothetical protein MMC25_006722 [Agyrium rufum]|nr:hypothetical protein [Agyrium rufum]